MGFASVKSALFRPRSQVQSKTRLLFRGNKKRERFCLQLLGEDGNLHCQMLRLDGRLFLRDGGVASPATYSGISTHSWRYFRHFNDGWVFWHLFVSNVILLRSQISYSWVKPSKFDFICIISSCFRSRSSCSQKRFKTLWHRSSKSFNSYFTK